MINVFDRIIEHVARYKLTPVSGTTDTYDFEIVAGEVTESGTTVNRTLLMALQGFYGNETVFNADGSITETNTVGDVKQTTFNADGSITEVFTSDGISISKQTTFNSDGSISEVLV